MHRTEFVWAGAPSVGVLRAPPGPVSMGVVTLHGASSATARQPMFEHLAMTLMPHGAAVLSYDRRSPAKHSDTELSVQASDAVLAMRALHEQLGVPVGTFGFSQGAWAATEAAGDDIASFLMVVGCSGVSPAEQMRFHTDEMLRRHGYGHREREKAGSLGAPFVVAVASSSISLDDHDVLNALYGTEVVEFRTLADGTESTAMARKPDGYWYGGDHWAHRGVSAVLVVNNLHPAFVGTQQHTIWEHPDPEVAVDGFPIWRRTVVEDGNMTFIEPVCSQAEWFGLGESWPAGEPFPR